MSPTDYLKIYVALQTSNPKLAVAAIATLRLAMIEEFGEEEQKNLVEKGNSAYQRILASKDFIE